MIARRLPSAFIRVELNSIKRVSHSCLTSQWIFGANSQGLSGWKLRRGGLCKNKASQCAFEDLKDRRVETERRSVS